MRDSFSANAVESFYDRSAQAEWQRLERHRTEFAVTCRALAEFLPAAPASVLDIGGGPGRYSIHLAQQGYTVTLADLSQASLEVARQKASETGVSLAGYVHANALSMEQIDSASFDAVLLMGPLYHLLETGERMQAVREAARVLKPGGILCAACISRFAPFRDSAKKNLSWMLEDPAYSLRLLETGLNDSYGDGFTRAYFMHPSEFEPLLVSAGLSPLALVATEGVAAENEELVNTLQGADWELWVEINYRIAHDPWAVGAADHLLCVGQKA